MNKIKVGDILKAKYDTTLFKKGDILEVGKNFQGDSYGFFYLNDRRGETHKIYIKKEILLKTFERQEKCKN